MRKVSYLLLIELLKQKNDFISFYLIVYYNQKKEKKKDWEQRSWETYTRSIQCQLLTSMYLSVSFAKCS